MSQSNTAARPRRPRKSAATGTVSSPNGSKQDRKDEDTSELTRLSVNLNAETAAALKELSERRGISLTETVRRAIAVLKFVEDEIQKGNSVQSTDGARTRELLLV